MAFVDPSRHAQDALRRTRAARRLYIPGHRSEAWRMRSTVYRRDLNARATAAVGSELTLVLVPSGGCRGQDHAVSAPAGSALILTRRLTLVAVAPSQLACFDLHEELPPSLPSWLVLSRRTVAQDDRLRALWALLVAEPEPDVAAPLATAFVRLAARHANTAPQVADPLVRRALEIALGDLTRRWTVPELARRVGLSRAAFCRRFRAAAGAPPERALTELRMRRAAELLATTELGLAAIAAQVGYASEHALGRAFKRWAGVAPGRYRARSAGHITALAA
ncbi:MAG: helix-turn-helix transcriptional regulator [Polyangiaceae bacterium]|nr:helix-turn-helix transcriptional regulator [Polyangiaceae bacterium]